MSSSPLSFILTMIPFLIGTVILVMTALWFWRRARALSDSYRAGKVTKSDYWIRTVFMLLPLSILGGAAIAMAGGVIMSRLPMMRGPYNEGAGLAFLFMLILLLVGGAAAVFGTAIIRLYYISRK